MFPTFVLVLMDVGKLICAYASISGHASRRHVQVNSHLISVRVNECGNTFPKSRKPACEAAAAAAAVTSAWRRSEGGTAETGASLQCIDQIKEALQLQKGKNMIFFLHIRFVNFLSHKMITLNVFLYSLSITHTHTVILKLITSTICR